MFQFVVGDRNFQMKFGFGCILDSCKRFLMKNYARLEYEGAQKNKCKCTPKNALRKMNSEICTPKYAEAKRASTIGQLSIVRASKKSGSEVIRTILDPKSIFIGIVQKQFECAPKANFVRKSSNNNIFVQVRLKSLRYKMGDLLKYSAMAFDNVTQTISYQPDKTK